MKNHDYSVNKIEALKGLAKTLIESFPSSRIFTFKGDLGSGKTTFIKEIIAHLGCAESVSSPTYSIVNEYISKGQPIFHIDLYRLKDVEEAIHIGIEEYLYSGHYCFIEWPQIAEQLLPSETIGIHIKIFDNSSRRLILSI